MARLLYTYDVVFTNHSGAQLHVYVGASTNYAAIRDAMTQLNGWGNTGAITDIHVTMLTIPE